MSNAPKPQIATRKAPQQARSTQLVAAILEAAIQVLAKEGAPRFTTARVAEKAGVSVGSVYQYFPNKAAILFRLQADEWRRTGDLLGRILGEAGQPPLARLRRLVHAFLESECAEAEMRGALDDAAPLYRDAPEAREIRAASRRTLDSFLQELLPQATAAQRQVVTELITTTLGAGGKAFSSQPRRAAEITSYAEAMADMFCAYITARLGATDGQDRSPAGGDTPPGNAPEQDQP